MPSTNRAPGHCLYLEHFLITAAVPIPDTYITLSPGRRPMNPKQPYTLQTLDPGSGGDHPSRPCGCHTTYHQMHNVMLQGRRTWKHKRLNQHTSKHLCSTAASLTTFTLNPWLQHFVTNSMFSHYTTTCVGVEHTCKTTAAKQGCRKKYTILPSAGAAQHIASRSQTHHICMRCACASHAHHIHITCKSQAHHICICGTCK